MPSETVIIPNTKSCCANQERLVGKIFKKMKVGGVGGGGVGAPEPPHPDSPAYGQIRWLFTSVFEEMNLRDCL